MLVANTKNNSVTNFFALSADKDFDGDYDWAHFEKTPKGYDKIVRVTYYIDLTQNADKIFEKFKQNTRNEISKCKQFESEINIDFDASLREVSDITKQMFLQKGINHAEEEAICILDDGESKKRRCIILKYDDIFIAHSYFIDSETSTVLLRTSASCFRDKDLNEKKLTGYLNRYLHYQEMLFFKKLGFHYLDLGGCGFLEQFVNKSPELKGIISFKESFGGQVKYIYKYVQNEHKLKRFFGFTKVHNHKILWFLGIKVLSYKTHKGDKK